jgi:amino acid transporter
MSTFGAVNGILLTSSRLFYAGACEGQMPEILTMIQIQRLTPTPAVLAISFVRNFFAILKLNINYNLYFVTVIYGLLVRVRHFRIN